MALLPWLLVCWALFGTTLNSDSDLVRLTDAVQPVRYDLDFLIDLPDPEEHRGYALRGNGTVSILLDVSRPVSEIKLHAAEDMKIFTVKLRKSSSEDEMQIRTQRNNRTSLLTVETDRKLASSSQYRLEIVFEFGERKSEPHNAKDYEGIYPTSGNYGKMTATTHLEPLGARKVFPCFDEPVFKAFFKISVAHRSQYQAISNMPVESKGEVRTNWTRTLFQKTPPMPSYLLALAIGDYKSVNSHIISSDGRNVSISFYIDKGDEVMENTTHYMMTYIPKMVQEFEKMFLTPFPLPKLDFVATNIGQAYAMENWGLITYSRFVMVFYKQGGTSLAIAAHEIAHQWFGDLVTMEWWSNLWLKEGFATYMSYQALNKLVKPKVDGLHQLMSVHVFSKSLLMEQEALPTGRTINTTIKANSDIYATFDVMAYGKTCYLIGMIHDTLGDEAFFKGTGNYLRQFSNSTATSEDLWKSYKAPDSEFPTETMNDIMQPWIYDWGFPLVTVRVDYSSGTLVVNQTRFVAYQAPPECFANPPVWTLELHLLNAAGDVARHWLRASDEEIQPPGFRVSESDWMIVRTKGLQHYRVNYDEKTWENIIGALARSSTTFSSLQKGDLVDDVWAVAMRELLSVEKAAQLTMAAARNETDFAFWWLLVRNLDTITRVFYGTDAQEEIERFVSTVVEHYKLSTRTPFAQQHKRVLLARNYLLSNANHEEFINNATDRLEAWAANNYSASEARNPLTYLEFCTSLRAREHERHVDEMMKIFNASNSYHLQLLSPLILQTENYEKFKAHMDLVTAEIPVQSIMWYPTVFRRCGPFRHNNLVRDYLIENWKNVSRDWNGELIARILETTVFYDVRSEQELKQMHDFKEEYFDDLNGAQNEFLLLEQRVARDNDWRSRMTQKMRSGLQKVLESCGPPGGAC